MTETPHPHAVFWIDVAKISTNPYQPRAFFDQDKLESLSDSIKRYGVLQPIVVTRAEEFTEEGGMVAKYELIAGERRLRASKLAGLEKIPAIIREGEQTDKEKLELAILENLQREDLNPVDKARSFARLVEEFDLTHAQVAERLGKSREYVSNSMRILALPDHMLDALSQSRISEGHTRPLLMLKDRPDEQETLFMQLVNSAGGMTVRDAETFARGIAKEKQRVDKDLDPEMKDMQQRLASHLGAKVQIDKSQNGGKVTIEFGNKDDLRKLFDIIKTEREEAQADMRVQVETEEQLENLSASTPLESSTNSFDSFNSFVPQQEIKEVPAEEKYIQPTYARSEEKVETSEPVILTRESNDLQSEMNQLAQAVASEPVTPELAIPQATQPVAAESVIEEEDQSKYSLNAMRQEIQEAKERHVASAAPEVTSGMHPEEKKTFAFNDSINEQSTGFNERNTGQIGPNPDVRVRPAIIGSEFKPQDDPEPLDENITIGGDFVPNKDKYLNPEGKTEPNSLANNKSEEKKDNDPYNFGTFTL